MPKKSAQKPKTKPSKPAAKSPQIDREEIVLAVINLYLNKGDRKTIENTIKRDYKLAARELAAVIKEATNRITEAALYSRGEEAGKSLLRLNKIYEQAIECNKINIALATQKEINRITGLYDPEPFTDAGEKNAETDAIRAILEPLELAPVGSPVLELVRIAAMRLTDDD